MGKNPESEGQLGLDMRRDEERLFFDDGNLIEEPTTADKKRLKEESLQALEQTKKKLHQQHPDWDKQQG